MARMRDKIRRWVLRAMGTDEFWGAMLAGRKTTAGEVVTTSTAEKYSAVYAAVSIIASDVAKLPLKLMQSDGKSRAVAYDHPVHELLATAPADGMTSYIFRQTIMRHVLLHGNGYAEIVRNGGGTVTALEIIDPRSMSVERAGAGITYIQTTSGGSLVRLAPTQVLHIRTMGDGLTGLSPITLHAETIGLGIAAMRAGAKLFGRGMRAGASLEHPARLSPEAHRNLQASVTAEGEGGGLIILEEGMKYSQMSINPSDAQYLETRVHQVRDIARIYRVPPHKLGDLADATFSNVEEQNLEYVEGCVNPWLIQWEQEISAKLLSEAERERLYPKFNVEGILRGNAQGRATFYARMFQIGALSINEIRAKEDMDEIDGGDEHYVPVNLRPADQEWEPAKPAQGAPANIANDAPGALGEGNDGQTTG